MEEFEVAIVNPEPQERSRVEIRKTSDGEEEIVAIISALQGDRGIKIEEFEKFPLIIRRKAFNALK